MLLKVFQPAEIVKAAMGKILGKANRYIDVAGIGLPAGRGAEQGNAHHAGGAEILFMRLQSAYHLVAVHGFILPHLMGARFDDTAVARDHTRVARRDPSNANFPLLTERSCDILISDTD